MSAGFGHRSSIRTDYFTIQICGQCILQSLENASDYAAMVAQRLAQDQPCVPVVLVRKADHPRGEALAHHLANRLHEWANRNPHPYAGPHWP